MEKRTGYFESNDLAKLTALIKQVLLNLCKHLRVKQVFKAQHVEELYNIRGLLAVFGQVQPLVIRHVFVHRDLVCLFTACGGFLHLKFLVHDLKVVQRLYRFFRRAFICILKERVAFVHCGIHWVLNQVEGL